MSRCIPVFALLWLFFFAFELMSYAQKTCVPLHIHIIKTLCAEEYLMHEPAAVYVTRGHRACLCACGGALGTTGLSPGV